MFIRNFKKLFFGLTLLSTTGIYAGNIPCPEINIIHDAVSHINISTKINDTYTVYSEDYVFINKKMYWRVGASQIIASSHHEALQKGKAFIQRTSYKKQNDATKLNSGEYKCTYGPEFVYALGVKFSHHK